MNNLMRILLGLSLAALLVSCIGPQRRETTPVQVDLPDTWKAAPTPHGSVPEAWWTLFSDPDLDALVREALRANHDIKEAAARVEAAQALARMAGADLVPAVSVGAGAARARTPGMLGDPVTENRLDVAFRISWEVDLWGRLRAGQVAAIEETELQRARYRGARLAVAAHTARAAFALVESREQLRLAETAVESYRDTLRTVRRRFGQGIAPSFDVRLAEANLASAEAGMQRRREVLDRTARRLETLLGRYPAGTVEGTRDLPPVPAPVPAGLPSELLERRPDLVAARCRVHAADARVFQARASLLPRLSLTAGGGAASGELSDLFKGSSLVWNLLGNAAQPLFQGGRLRANLDLQKARTREALEAYATACLGAFREVETSLASEQLLKARAAQLERAALHGALAARQAEERYRTGLDGIVPVLEAQRRELEAEGRLLAVRRELLDNRVTLHLALGGGFSP